MEMPLYGRYKEGCVYAGFPQTKFEFEFELEVQSSIEGRPICMCKARGVKAKVFAHERISMTIRPFDASNKRRSTMS